jgi:DNA sulfur modification protein DndD
MILKKLVMENWGPFYGNSSGIIDFGVDSKEGSLFLIHGNNARGKTSILRALVYALFGSNNGEIKTNNLQRDKTLIRQMFNQKALEEDSGTSELKIELRFEHENKEYRLTRQAFIKNHDQKNESVEEELNLIEISPKKTTSYKDKDAKHHIERNILQPELRDFFFFDGEEVYNFQEQLKTKKPEDLEDKINLMLGLNHFIKATTVFKNHYEKLTKEIRSIDKELKENKNLLITIENLEKQLVETDDEIAEIKKGIVNHEILLDTIEEDLKSDDEAKELLTEQRHIESDLNKIQKDIEKTKIALANIVQANWLSPLENATKFKDLGKLNKLLLKGNNKSYEGQLISEAVRTKKLWGAKLTPDIINKFRETKSSLEEEISDGQNEVNKFNKKVDSIANMREAMSSQSIFSAEQALLLNDIRITELQTRYNEINTLLKNTDKKEFPVLQKKRDNTKVAVARMKDTLDQLEVEKEQQEKWIQVKANQLEKNDSPQDSKTRIYAEIFDALAESFEAAKEPVIEKTKKRVEDDTSKIFEAMDSNKDRIGVKINEDYTVEIKRNDNEYSPKENSAALLVMTLSLLQGISMNAPGQYCLVIDTPLGKVDSKESEYIYKGLADHGEQIILLVQDTEWYEDMRNKVGNRIMGEVTLARKEKNNSTLSEIIPGFNSDKLEYM